MTVSPSWRAELGELTQPSWLSGRAVVRPEFQFRRLGLVGGRFEPLVDGDHPLVVRRLFRGLVRESLDERLFAEAEQVEVRPEVAHARRDRFARGGDLVAPVGRN